MSGLSVNGAAGGLTRQQLAHQIGCGVITLRKIEAEERRPSVKIVAPV